MRSLAIYHKVAFITAGRRDLVEISQSDEVRRSPFFNIFATIDLQPFTRTPMRDEESLPLNSRLMSEGTVLKSRYQTSFLM